MTITQRTHGAAQVLDLAGVLGVGNTVALDDTVRTLVAGGHHEIVVNMAEVSHVDSTGLAMLVAAYAAVNHVGGRLFLASLTARVRKVLAVTHLLAVFDTCDSEETCLAQLGRHALA
jgi:anti-sigma B factor antagonist